MHELSLSSAIVDTAVRHAQGRRVLQVNMLIGRMRQVVPESLEFYFGIVARDTPCEGAVLQQTIVPAMLRCSACGCGWELDSPDFRCPACATAEFEITSGAEFEVESIEIQDEEACTAPK